MALCLLFVWKRNIQEGKHSMCVCAQDYQYLLAAGNRYGFEVSNRLGSVRGNITLVVKEEEEEEEVEDVSNICLETHAVKVEEFGEYVADMHTKNNQGFVKQFQVNTSCSCVHTAQHA